MIMWSDSVQISSEIWKRINITSPTTKDIQMHFPKPSTNAFSNPSYKNAKQCTLNKLDSTCRQSLLKVQTPQQLDNKF